MSSLGTFVLLLALSIIILTVLILKCKMHPVISLLFSAIFLSVSLGNSVVTTMDTINAGFGGTMSGIGVPIILGATLAMAIHVWGYYHHADNPHRIRSCKKEKDIYGHNDNDD